VKQRRARYGLGGHKYHTNVLYLQDKDLMIANFLRFIQVMTDGEYQFKRLKVFFENLDRGNYIPLNGGSYFNLGQAVRMIVRDPQAVALAVDRIARFIGKPRNIIWFIKGFFFVLGRPGIQNRFSYLKFWLTLWTTIIVKYHKVSAADFDIASVPADFDISRIIPRGYEDGAVDAADLGIKKKAQRRETLKQLHALVEQRKAG
jgi:hypothetical protein